MTSEAAVMTSPELLEKNSHRHCLNAVSDHMAPSAPGEEPAASPVTTPQAFCTPNNIVFGLALALLLVASIAAVIIIGTLQLPASDKLGYGVVMDLGSSGSRVHIYQWNVATEGPGYEMDSIQPAPAGARSVWSKRVGPGVSSYSESPSDAARSVQPLLDYALSELQSHRIDPSEVPLVCYATAGMRMLPKDVSAEVMSAIRTLIMDNYPFATSEEFIRVIAGQEEALFDFVAIQQVLRVFDPEDQGRKKIGALDLGGSSVELAFQVASHHVNEGPVTRSQEPAYVTPVLFNDTVVDVYGVAYTGLGHNAAFDSILELAVTLQAQNLAVGDTYPHPCLHYGSTHVHHADDDDDTNDVRYVGTGDWATCVEMTRLLMNRSASCQADVCAFNGVYQPEPEGFFVAMDDFASTAEFFQVGVQPVLRDFIPATQEYCRLEWEYVMSSGQFQKKESRLRELCFEGIFIHELLTYGFGFPEGSSRILFSDQLLGVAMNWGLGAMRLRLEDLLATGR